MIELKAQKISMALFVYCKKYKYCDYDMPSMMATSMAVFLLKHPKLLQEPKYKNLYENLLEFQIEDVFLCLYDFDKQWGTTLDRDTLKGTVEMLNDMELQDIDSKVYKLKLSDIDDFILNYYY